MGIRKTFKPRDVEEWVDYHVHRPVAEALVQLVKHTPLTPNQVTVLSGLLGLCAGVAVLLAGSLGRQMVVVGGALLFSSIIFDCVDGQLARLRGESTLAGRALDGFVDPIAPVSVFIGLAFFLMAEGISNWLIWPIGWLAGISMLWHTNCYDHAKNVFLHNARAQIDLGGRPLLSVEEIDRERQLYRERRQRAMLFFLYLFYVYTRNQRRKNTSEIEQERPITASAREREIYREVFIGAMRAWSWLGLGTHLAALVTTCLLAPLSPWIVFGTWGLFLVPGNLLTLYLLRTLPRRVKQYERRVAQADR